MKLDLDLDALGLTEADVIDTIRRALSLTISDREGPDGDMADERALLDALADPDADEDHEPRPVTDEDLEAWVVKVHEMRETHRREHFANLDPVPLTIEKGRKYARIVANHSNQRMVYCFVRLENGDILKSATWRAPAKHARGNIFAVNPLGGLSQYGATYLR
jgi:hypothetical protein